jgi:hypothetical protein
MLAAQPQGAESAHGKVIAIDAIADPARLRQLDVAVLND